MGSEPMKAALAKSRVQAVDRLRNQSAVFHAIGRSGTAIRLLLSRQRQASSAKCPEISPGIWFGSQETRRFFIKLVGNGWGSPKPRPAEVRVPGFVMPSGHLALGTEEEDKPKGSAASLNRQV